MAVKIITDSVADIPQAIAQALDITVMPLTVNFEDQSYRDGIDISNADFFEKMANSAQLPTTSQVTIGIFEEKFRELLQGDDQYLGIFMSSKLSGTYSAAVTALEMVNSDRIVVMDSRLVSFTMGQVVIVAAELARSGFGLSALVKRVDQMIDATESRYIFDTLDNLRKGGRINATEAVVGSLLNIKPLLSIIDGEMQAVGKARGRKKALQQLFDWLDENDFDLNNKFVSLFHAVNAGYLDVLYEQLEMRYPKAHITRSEVGAVVGTHAGPGCLAMSFINIDKDHL